MNAYLALQPKINIANASTIENSGSVNVTITLSAASTSIVTVKYLTSNGTALTGTDYTSTSGTVSFAIGETSKTVNVAILDDLISEISKSFQITLSDPTNAAIIDGVSTVQILDNDTSDSVDPTITGPTTISIPENTTTVTSYSADEDVVWSISGDDSDKFTIDTVTGEIVFKSAPDFENPSDIDTNNTYLVILTATD